MQPDAHGLLEAPPESPGPTPRLVLASLVALAAGVRIGTAWQTAVIFNDGPSFLAVAALFHEGRWADAFAHSYHPLYPLLTALLAPVVGDFARAGVWISVVSGALAVAALHAFLKAAFGARAAFGGAALLAVHPYASRYSADVQSEGLYMVLFLAALAAAWRAIDRASPLRAAGAGALSAAAYLVRPEGLGVAVVALAFCALLLVQGRMAVSVFLRVAAALVVGAIVVGGPYVAYLHEVTGRFTLTQKKSVRDFTTPPRPAPLLDPGEPDRQRFRPPPLRRPSPREASLLPARFDFEPRAVSAALDLVQVGAGAFQPMLLLLLVLGISRVRGPPGDRAVFVLLVVGLYGVVLYGLALNVGYLHRRHVLVPLLPLLGYAALGLPVLGQLLLRAVQPRRDVRGARSATVLALSIVVVVSLAKTWSPHREERLAVRQAAEWLASRPEHSGPVAAEKHRAAWYAGQAFIDLRRVAQGGELAQQGARFLIVDDVQLAQRPALQAARARYEELFRVEAAGRTAFVYSVPAVPVPVVPEPPPGSTD